MERWRTIDCGAVTPFENAAVMPVLSREVAGGADPIVITSVWGQTHLNVGWFDDVDSTLDLAGCERLSGVQRPRPLHRGRIALHDLSFARMWGLLLPQDRHPGLYGQLLRFQAV